MRITGSDLAVVIDPLSYASGINELNGSPLQSYDKSEGTYSPSRTLVPYVILPWVATVDESNGQQSLSGRQPLTNVVYNISRMVGSTYQTVSLPASTLAGFEVATAAGVVSGVNVPKWALVVTADIPNGSSVNIECIVSFTDPQTGKTATQTVTTSLSTNTTETASFQLLTSAEFLPYRKLNPLVIAKDDDGERHDTIAVQLYRNGEAVADANAAYYWYSVEGSVETLITKDNQLAIADSQFDASGNLGKSIVLRADYFDSISLVCRAAYVKDGASRPSVPTDPLLALRFSRVRRLPPNVTGQVIGSEGAKILMTSTISRKLQLSSRTGIISDALASELYRVRWVATKSTGASTELGSGLSISAKASDLGVTNNVSVALIPEVAETACLKAKRTNSSSEDDPTIVTTDDGTVIVYENTINN